jgi:hypothetical protein
MASMTARFASASQARVKVPTRNSSSIGWSSGAASVSSAGAMAGTDGSPPVRRTTSSSSASRRSARTATCSFSRATVVSRLPARACRKNVREPGSPTVPTTNRSGSS